MFVSPVVARLRDPTPFYDVALAVRTECESRVPAIDIPPERTVHADEGVLLLYEELNERQLVDLMSGCALAMDDSEYILMWRSFSLRWGEAGRWGGNPFDLAVKLSFTYLNNEGDDDEY